MTQPEYIQPVLAGIGAWHIVGFLAIVLILFGGAKLPELARGLAKGIRIFRDELHGTAKDVQDTLENPPAQPTQQAQAPEDADKKA